MLNKIFSFFILYYKQYKNPFVLKQINKSRKKFC